MSTTPPPVPYLTRQGAYAPSAPAQEGNSGMGIASFVLGILGLFGGGVCAIVGLVLGIVAYRRGTSEGRSVTLAAWGIALSGFWLAVILLIIGLAVGGAFDTQSTY